MLSTLRRQPWVLGGIVYVLAAQYFVGEQIAAAAWTDPPYDWRHDYISDLGVVTCTEVSGICSPLHAVMNASFVLLGLIVICGSVLLRSCLDPTPARTLFVGLMSASGVGDVLVGTFPGSVDAAASGTNLLHVLGAVLAIVGGNAGIMVAGIALIRSDRHRAIGFYSIASGMVGLAAFALFALGRDLGIGIGLVERVAADPITMWMIVVGTAALVLGIRSQLVRRSAVRSPD